MAKKRKRKAVPTLGTIWEISDDLWERIRPILVEFWPKKATGRKVANWRQILNGIIFRMRSGCQWNHLPEELPDDSTVHRTFQRWVRLGVLKAIWATVLAACEELGGVDWEWQAADAALGKARFGGTTSAPTRPTAARTG